MVSGVDTCIKKDNKKYPLSEMLQERIFFRQCRKTIMCGCSIRSYKSAAAISTYFKKNLCNDDYEKSQASREICKKGKCKAIRR